MATADKVSPYSLARDFELETLRHLVFENRFWSRLGRAVEPDAFSTDSARLVAQAAMAIGHETGKSPGSGSLIVQRVQRWRHEGRCTHEQVLDVDDLVGELEDITAPADVDSVVAELVPVIKERRNRESIRLAMKKVGSREELDEVIDHLQETARLGVGQSVLGVAVDHRAVEIVRQFTDQTRLPTGIMELDYELMGGPVRKTLSVCMGGAGDGKCHAAGTEIFMYDGTTKRVEDIIVGDALIGPEGYPRNVLAINQGRGYMYDIIPANGVGAARPFRVNGDHYLTLARHIHRQKREYIDVKVTEWLRWSPQMKAHYRLFRCPDVVFGRTRGPAFQYGTLRNHRFQFSVVPTFETDNYYGFTLDGDGRYLLADYTCTHNSMMLCQVAGASMRSGRHTAVATLELSEAQWISRVLANLTGLRINDVALPEREKELIARLEELGGLGHCEIAQFTPEVTTVRELLDWVADVEQRRGVAIETLVVDYADLLGHSRKRDYEGMREVYSGLREEFAVARNGWAWTASQSRRKRKSNERQGANDGADSQNKIRVCDLWVTLDASEDGGEMTYRISKNRGGSRGAMITLPTDFSTARLAPDLGSLEPDDGSLDLF